MDKIVLESGERRAEGSMRPSPALHQDDINQIIDLIMTARNALDSVSSVLHQMKRLGMTQAWYYQGLNGKQQEAAFKELMETQTTVRSLSAWFSREASLLNVRHASIEPSAAVYSTPRPAHPGTISEQRAGVLAAEMRQSLRTTTMLFPGSVAHRIAKLFR